MSGSETFTDLFSGHAAAYARYRPTYPDALFTCIEEAMRRHDCAWDCATGSGQAAIALAAHVQHVIATDASAEQLAHAAAHPRVEYHQARAEASGLAEASIDLVTVAAGVHWFQLDAFYAEVRRVCRPRAVVAFWTYGPRVEISPELDALVDELAQERLADHWAPAIIRYVEPGYSTLPFPFEELPSPALACRTSWPLEGLVDFIRTWSGVQTAIAATGCDVVAEVAPRLAEAWGGAARREVKLPLYLRLGRI